MTMTVFDPRKFSCSFNNVPLSGFGGGVFFKATRRKAFGALEELGADGEGAFVLSGDHSYVVEITFKKISPSNTILSQWGNATKMGAPVIGPLTGYDAGTGARFDSEDAMLVNGPPFEREGGEKYGDNVWTWHVKKGAESQPGSST